MEYSVINIVKQPLRRVRDAFVKQPLHRMRDAFEKWRYPPLIPPSRLHNVGSMSVKDYEAIGTEFLRHFVELCHLRPHEHVLDLGCGSGRIARALVNYLQHPGGYVGIDIVAPTIEWCREAYSGHTNFKFMHADVYNKQYNSSGSVVAQDYKVPLPDRTFDLAFLTSVFTHMLPEGVANYMSEVQRLLRPGQRCLITWFLLNAHTRELIEAGRSQFRFPHKLDGCYTELVKVPEAAVAYDEEYVRELYVAKGFRIDRMYYGAWRGETGLSGQDIIVAMKT